MLASRSGLKQASIGGQGEAGGVVQVPSKQGFALGGGQAAIHPCKWTIDQGRREAPAGSAPELYLVSINQHIT
jgi:hypothetical protein